MLLVNAAAPSRAALGTTNGLAQSLASLSRAIAPASASVIFAVSVDKGVAGGYLIWIVLVALSLAAIGTSWLLDDTPTLAR